MNINQDEEAKERFRRVSKVANDEFTAHETMFVLVAVIESDDRKGVRLAVAANGSIEAVINMLEFEAKHLREQVLQQDPGEGEAGHA